MVVAASTDKGSATREMILDRAYLLASRKGVEGLSIGELAAAAKMSKSGVFAHFGSREELQLAVLEYGAQRFGERVFVPALRAKRGLPRLRAIVYGWFDWVRENRYGCLLMGAVNEYDARPGPQRDRVVALMELWRTECARAVSLAIETRELRADTDARQFAFEVFGISLALHQDTRLFDPKQARTQAERAFERLIAAHSR
ncbi:MAG: TetR/AcrR family transcriptional regulator [Proteobacteria bacterium]|uniref:TetR/AcrR family transcriptional regulator n=1 Tax=Rudaea sp. TaxID=2136325 RepID=UPI0032206747|nr:TetR/AcrR family transcriptional regulator [Pseudomonadota bacterium]